MNDTTESAGPLPDLAAALEAKLTAEAGEDEDENENEDEDGEENEGDEENEDDDPVFELSADQPLITDTLHAGQCYFRGGCEAFLVEHDGKALTVDEQGWPWVYPAAGGKAVALSAWRSQSTATLLKVR